MARTDIKCNVPAIINFSKQSVSNVIEWKIQKTIQSFLTYNIVVHLNLSYAAVWLFWIMIFLRFLHLIMSIAIFQKLSSIHCASFSCICHLEHKHQHLFNAIWIVYMNVFKNANTIYTRLIFIFHSIFHW